MFACPGPSAIRFPTDAAGTAFLFLVRSQPGVNQLFLSPAVRLFFIKLALSWQFRAWQCRVAVSVYWQSHALSYSKHMKFV